MARTTSTGASPNPATAPTARLFNAKATCRLRSRQRVPPAPGVVRPGGTNAIWPQPRQALGMLPGGRGVYRDPAAKTSLANQLNPSPIVLLMFRVANVGIKTQAAQSRFVPEFGLPKINESSGSWTSFHTGVCRRIGFVRPVFCPGPRASEWRCPDAPGTSFESRQPSSSAKPPRYRRWHR